MDKLQNLQPWQQVQGIYVHIPFCRQKCLYCDFNSYAGFGAEVMAKYAAAVCREIAGRRKDVPVNANASIYFGGGTPSLLPAEAIKRNYGRFKKSTAGGKILARRLSRQIPALLIFRN